MARFDAGDGDGAVLGAAIEGAAADLAATLPSLTDAALLRKTYKIGDKEIGPVEDCVACRIAGREC